MQDIIGRVNEIKVKKSIGADITHEHDFPWLGAIDRSDESINSALQRLENPLMRIKEEMFWFWISTDADSEALNRLAHGKRQAAHELWKENINEYESASVKKITAFFNQTILAHSSALIKEVETKGSKELDSDLHWKNWTFIIQKFMQLHSSDIFWSAISDRAKRINDPRLSARKIEEIKENFIEELAGINFKCISRALAVKDLPRAAHHIALLKTLKLPKDYFKASINSVLANHTESINHQCIALEKDADKLVEENSSSPLIQRYEVFLQTVQPLIVEADLVDDTLVSDYALSRDLVAAALRDVSIKLHNKFEEFEKSHEVMQKAILYVTSEYKKDQFRKDEGLLKSHAEEAKSINYEDKIGFKKISVSKEKIIFGNKTFLTKEIQAMRYGIYTHSTNGIKDSQSYKIWLWDGKSVMEIECASGLGAWSDKAGKKFNAILESLYQTVQMRLITKMIDDFEKTGSTSLGGIIIDYTGWHRNFSYDPVSKGLISLTAKVFKTKDVGTKEDQKKNLSWNDYGGYNKADGNIYIFREENKKKENWTSLSVRDDWNAVNLSIFLDYLHKDGKLWRIIKTKPFEKKAERTTEPAPIAESKKQTNEVRPTPPSSSGESNFLRKIPWWVWLLGGIYLWVFLVDWGGSSSTTPDSYKPTSQSLTRLKNRMANLKTQVEQKEPTLRSMQSEVETAEKQLTHYRNSIEQIESEYNSDNIPTDIERHYDSIINAHNVLLEKYNQLLEVYNTLHAAYKVDIQQYNDLVEKYNERVRND